MIHHLIRYSKTFPGLSCEPSAQPPPTWRVRYFDFGVLVPCLAPTVYLWLFSCPPAWLCIGCFCLPPGILLSSQSRFTVFSRSIATSCATHFFTTLQCCLWHHKRSCYSAPRLFVRLFLSTLPLMVREDQCQVINLIRLHTNLTQLRPQIYSKTQELRQSLVWITAFKKYLDLHLLQFIHSWKFWITFKMDKAYYL